MAFRKVAQFKEISLEYVALTGAAKLQFFTDMPGNHLAERTTSGGLSMPVTNADNTPQTITFPLITADSAPLQGTLYYPRVTPYATGIAQLRSGVVVLRVIGVYLDGSTGEFFETQPISIGV